MTRLFKPSGSAAAKKVKFDKNENPISHLFSKNLSTSNRYSLAPSHFETEYSNLLVSFLSKLQLDWKGVDIRMNSVDVLKVKTSWDPSMSALEIAPPGAIAVKTKTDYVVPRSSPIQDAKRRRWVSSRAASLLDNQDDDEEEEVPAEPGLHMIPDDDNSTGSFSRRQKIQAISPGGHSCSPDEEQGPSSQLARFSENMSGMATFLCPAVIDDADALLIKSSNTLKNHHRSSSETDSLQIIISSGPCGTNSGFCPDSSSSDVGKPPLTKGFGTPDCTDLDMTAFQRDLITELTSLLGSTSGAADDLVCTMRKWLVAKHGTKIRNRRVRNRCALRNAKSRRVVYLWQSWHSTYSTQSVNVRPENSSNSFGTCKSFDGIIHDETSRTRGNSFDAFYDSDPEDFATSSRRKSTLLLRPSVIDTTASFASVECPLTPRASHWKGAPSFDSKCLASKSMESATAEEELLSTDVWLWDDVMVKDFIKDLTLGEISLVWHPSQTSRSSSETEEHQQHGTQAPLAVQAWFESGSHLQSTVVHPKFMWREVYQPEINNRRLSPSCRSPKSLDLLCMVRILAPTEIDRSIYPYAKAHLAFMIKSHDGNVYLFEAQSKRERDWFVRGLKLVVARLASMIIVGDQHMMFSEFFSPWSYVSTNRDSMLEDSKAGDDEDQSKPFYASTTKTDRQGLWGGHAKATIAD